MRTRVLGLAMMLLAAAVGQVEAQGAETAGMITELKPGRGRVDVRAAAGGDWKPAAPLQAVRPGDVLRASDNAVVVLAMTGGAGMVKVDAAVSPYTVPALRAGDGKVQKARSLVEAGVGFLATNAKEPPRASLSTRGVSRPPVIIAPRNGLVLPEPLTIEWMGSRFTRYTVRVVGPAGVVFEQAGVTGGRFEYPASAPALGPGTRYTVLIAAAGHAAQEAWFTVADGPRAAAVRRELDTVGGLAGVTPNSQAVLRAGVLANEGFVYDARREIVAALAKDGDEPALHQFLGALYQQSGLPDLAVESFDEAQFLLTRAR